MNCCADGTCEDFAVLYYFSVFSFARPAIADEIINLILCLTHGKIPKVFLTVMSFVSMIKNDQVILLLYKAKTVYSPEFVNAHQGKFIYNAKPISDCKQVR